MWHALRTGIRMQVWVTRHKPDDFLLMATTPLIAVVFLSVTLNAGRPDLLANALLAPVLMGLWTTSVSSAGFVLADDRWQGTLEAAVAAPLGMQAVLFGRVCTLSGVGLLPLAETWLVARLAFGVTPEVHHPVPFVVAMVLTAVTTACTSTVFAALFLLSRNTVVISNFMGPPFFLLSGVLVPVMFLPDFMEPFSRVIFLYWSADLLRDCLTPAPVDHLLPRLGAIALLGGLALLLGRYLMRIVLVRVRELGTLGNA